MSFGSLLFTPQVKELQGRYGSRRQYERMETSGPSRDRLGAFESEFLAERDTFTGQPQEPPDGLTFSIAVGPKGFIKVIDDRTLAFADFRGNTQYVSTGNLH